MSASDSSTRPSVVKISGLVELYKTTLQSRGYGAGATQAYVRAVEHFIAWATPASDCIEAGDALIRRFVDEHRECSNEWASTLSVWVRGWGRV